MLSGQSVMEVKSVLQTCISFSADGTWRSQFTCACVRHYVSSWANQSAQVHWYPVVSPLCDVCSPSRVSRSSVLSTGGAGLINMIKMFIGGHIAAGIVCAVSATAWAVETLGNALYYRQVGLHDNVLSLCH